MRSTNKKEVFIHKTQLLFFHPRGWTTLPNTRGQAYEALEILKGGQYPIFYVEWLTGHISNMYVDE